MSTERSGITIIVDTGKRREIINIPVAEEVDVELLHTPKTPAFYDPRFMLPPVLEVELVRFSFKPIGNYTIKKEDLP